MNSRYYRLAICYAVFFLCSTALSGTDVTEDSKQWSKGFDWTINKESPVFRFMLFNLHRDGSELTAECVYENYEVAEEVRPAVVIQGKRTPDERFWPAVRYEVKKDPQSDWQPLKAREIKGNTASIIIEPSATRTDLTVDCDVFKPYILTHALGRLILATGDRAEFPLSDLAPPKQSR